MVPAQVLYDPASDQLVIRLAADGGVGDVELARIDVVGLTQPDLVKLAHVRDPDQPLPAAGSTSVTRRDI